MLTLIAIDTLKENVCIRQNAVIVSGIAGNSHTISTMGIVSDGVSFKQTSVRFDFHLIERAHALAGDGYLGLDFLLKFQAVIDLHKNVIKFTKPANAQFDSPQNELNEVHAISKLHYDNTCCFDWTDTGRGVLKIECSDRSNDCYSESSGHYTRLSNLIGCNQNISQDARILKTLNTREFFNSNQIANNQNNYRLAHAVPLGLDISFVDQSLDSNCEKISQIESMGSFLNFDVQKFTIFANKTEQNFIHEETNENIHFDNINHIHTFAIWKQNAILNFSNSNISTREEFIMNNLPLSHCSPDEMERIRAFVLEFQLQFHVEGDPLSKTDLIQHRINLKPNVSPACVKQFRIPQSHREKLKNLVREYEELGVLEKCNSNFNAPAFFVKKKDSFGKYTELRLVIDYSKLNEITQSQHFPIPLIDEIFDDLGGCKWFSTLDIDRAFHQVEIHPDDRDYSAFSVGGMKYRWVRMPFGLSGGPLTFQRLVNLIFCDLIGNGVHIYLDDIIIYAETRERHDEILRIVLQRLRQYSLQLKITKCHFYCTEVEYLGHIISKDGLRANPEKVECIVKYPQPKNLIELLRFLGMCGYFRIFVYNFALISKPLTHLCSKEIIFVWSKSAENAFESLKRALAEDVILQFPDFSKDFFVTTDASDFAIGGMLSQGELPNDRPLRFYSKTLNGPQRNYSTIQRELLSIYLNIEAYRNYLYGRNFIVLCDHRPLVHLYNLKDPNSRLVRIRIELSDYQFKVIHIPGNRNNVADALSRISIDDAKPLEQVIEENTDSESQKICRAITRQKAKLSDLPSDNRSDFRIHEDSGFLIKPGKFDHVFSIISSRQAKTLERIIDTSKEDFADFQNNLKPLDRMRSLAILKIGVNPELNTSLFHAIVNQIAKIIDENDLDDVAINIDLGNEQNLFAFKWTLREKFAGTKIGVTIYLNNIIELTQIQHIQQVLRLYHESMLGGHCGIERMKKTIGKFYKWPTMSKDIIEFVKSCLICEKTKVVKNTKVPLQITGAGARPFEHIFIDYVGPINPESSGGHKYVFSATCDLTKYVIAVPTIDCTAETTADCLVENIILKYDFPSKLTADNASYFRAEMFRELNKKLKIKQIFSTPYHPQSNITERQHRTINQYMRAFTKNHATEWHRIIPFATFAINNTVSTSTGFTPHELVFGQKVRIPNSLMTNKPIYTYDNYAEDTRIRIKEALDLAAENLAKRKIANKTAHDKTAKPLDVKPGDPILVKKQHKDGKFSEIFEGPFIVESVPSEQYVEFKRGNRKVKIHKNHIKISQASQSDSI